MQDSQKGCSLSRPSSHEASKILEGDEAKDCRRERPVSFTSAWFWYQQNGASRLSSMKVDRLAQQVPQFVEKIGDSFERCSVDFGIDEFPEFL